ncbi:MAG TPA: AAA family ATPase [Syntrophorhabdales bacterium]|nr:AAA family ATPase [Syntrophorhabdales bacterium]
MKCPKCDAENRDVAQFCRACGGKLESCCPACGKRNPLANGFCDGCGHPLKFEAHPPPIDSSTARPSAPAFQPDTVPVAKGPAEGERKQVTVLFSDLSGYSALSERLDPEEMREITGRIFGDVARVVSQYDGFIEKYIGDVIMALFGVPKSHEDDHIRALKAAREIHEIASAVGEEYIEKIGVGLSFHTGITTGLVVTGEVNLEKGTHGLTGDTINIASRLCSLARPGEILVGESTCLKSAGTFSFAKLDPVFVKGKAGAVIPYRLIEEREKASRGLAGLGLASPLVGRTAEIAAIKASLNRLLDGQGSILFLTGEAGLGKSRLMAEIRNAFAHEGLLWLEGKTLSYGQKMSYWPFREILWLFTGITEDDNEVEAWEKFEAKIVAQFPVDSGEVLPYLASLIGLEVRGDFSKSLRHLDGESMGRQIYLASRRFFERLARKPLVLVFEDLHWADESTVLLIEHLFPLVNRVPLLICGLSRPETIAPAARLRNTALKDHGRRYTEIRLNPLSPAECTDLMDNLLHIENLSSRTRQLILHKADGNPFFVEEIMRTFVYSGAVRYENGRWKATSQIETMTIPDTIQGVITARIDLLDDELKNVLKAASVIGRTFLYRLLKGVIERSKELDGSLAFLRVTELIRERQRIPELEYMFNHALVQESTYESILLKKRHELHARVASAIESIFSERLDEFVSVLAYHYAKAEQWEKAQEYLFRAGDQAGRIAADAEALTHYRQALETYARVFGDKWDPLERGKLERKMGEAFYRRGEHEKAAEYFQRALTNLSRPLPTSGLGVRLAILREILVQAGHRLTPGRLMIGRSEDQSQATEEEARIYEAQGLIYVVNNVKKSLLSSLRRLNFSERRGYDRGVITGAAFVQGVAITLGLRRVGAYYGRKAMAAAEAVEDRGAIGYACTATTLQEVAAGRLESAIDYGLRALEYLRESGYWDPRVWSFATIFTGWWAFGFTGQYDETLKRGRDLARMGEDAGDPESLCFGLDILGSTQCLTGQLDEAESNLRRAIDLAETIPDEATRIAAGSHLGRCYIRQNNLAAAMASLRQTEEYLTTHRMSRYFVSAFLRNAMAEACLCAAEASSGTERRRWLRESRRRCKDALRASRRYFRPLLPDAMRLQGTYEWLKGKPLAAEGWWERSLDAAEKMGMPHYSGLAHLEMGKRLGQGDRLKEAIAILGRIGAEFDLEEARKCLDRLERRGRIDSFPPASAKGDDR